MATFQLSGLFPLMIYALPEAIVAQVDIFLAP